MTQLVDDQWLGAILRGEPPPMPDDDVFTTGYWYVRLCQAVLNAGDRTGVCHRRSHRFPTTPEPALCEPCWSYQNPSGW